MCANGDNSAHSKESIVLHLFLHPKGDESSFVKQEKKTTAYFLTSNHWTQLPNSDVGKVLEVGGFYTLKL